MRRWPTKPLSSFCRTGSGGTPSRGKPEYFDGGTVPWVKSGELKETIVLNTAERITEAATKETNARIVPKNAVLVAMYGATVGETAILGIEAATNQAVCHIIPDPNTADFRYVWYALKSRLDELLSKRVGGAQPNISQGIIRDTAIPVPPMAEQERIVKLLDEADELRKLRTEADRRTTDLLPALFDEMFGDAGLRCESATLEDAVEQFIDYRGKTPAKSASGVPLVTAKIVKGGRILPATEFISEDIYDAWMRRGLPKHADVLFTMEAPLGEVAMVEETRIALAQRILLMRPRGDLLDSRYFMTALKMPSVWRQIEERATGSTVRGIRQAELRKVRMPIPPLPLQKEFAKRVTEIRGLETEQAASRARLDALFQSTLHRAFQGEL